MNNLTPFNYQGKQVRTVIIDGEPWFVAKDVCAVLELDEVHKAVGRVDDDERNLIPVTDGLGREQDSWIINEAGLYSLILGSRKPEARDFKRWVTHEVLPAIHKTGSYSVQPVTPTEALLQAVQILAAQEKKINDLEAKVTVTQHRIDSLDTTNIQGTPQQRLNAMVRKYAYDNGIIYAKGYEEFKSAFNTAYHTNLEARRLNYISLHNLKSLTMPQYLTKSGLIEDALRVADKLLNRVS